MSRWWVLCAVAALGFFAAPAAGADAHAGLSEAEPAPGEEVPAPPSQLTLRFTQDLVPDGSWVQVRDAGGENLVREILFDENEPRVMRVLVPRLDPGMYEVVWQSLSAEDDDYDGGTYSFTVLNPDGSLPGSAQQESGTDTATLLAVVAATVTVAVAAVFALKYRRPS